jgi:hypothetical protein
MNESIERNDADGNSDLFAVTAYIGPKKEALWLAALIQCAAIGVNVDVTEMITDADGKIIKP